LQNYGSRSAVSYASAKTRSGDTLLRKLSFAHREELQRTGPTLARALKTTMRASRKEKPQAA